MTVAASGRYFGPDSILPPRRICPTKISLIISCLRVDGWVEQLPSTFTPGQLNYSLTGMPSAANAYLFEKSNGTFDLALWNEPTIWNPGTHQAITASNNTVTVNLGQ